MSMPHRIPRQNSEKRFSPPTLDAVRVGGRYRVGKLLGTGGSGELNRDSSLTLFLSSLGSVYLGKDIMTGADVALKIGHPSRLPSSLSHEHNVYATIAGSKGVSQVLWYGKEDVYEVIVLNHLGTSLGDLIDQPNFDRRMTFVYATQMVRVLYKTNDHTKHTLAYSSQQSSLFMIIITFIATLNPGISRFALITLLHSSSSISAWHSYSAIPQLICISLSQRIIQSLVPFRSHPSMASKEIPSRVVMTWSLSPIPSFIQHSVTCLGPAIRQATTRRQSFARKRLSRRRSCAKVYPVPSANSSRMSVLLALRRNRTISIFILSLYSARKPRLISPVISLSKQNPCTHIPMSA